MSKAFDSPTATLDRFARIWRNLLLGCGTLFLAIGLLLLVREIRFGHTAMSANGTIAEVLVTDTGDGPTYTPVVEFTAVGDQTVRFTGLATNPRPVQGQSVPVLYRRDEIGDARIDSFVQRWLFPVVFSLVGLVAIAGVIASQLGWLRGLAQSPEAL